MNLSESATTLRAELGDAVTIDDATIKKYEGLLEKKWTSVVRLQKKVGSGKRERLLWRGDCRIALTSVSPIGLFR